MARNTLFLKSDQVLGIESLVDSEGSSVTNATITASIFKTSPPFLLGTATAPIQEIQKLAPNVIATGGTFKLGYRGAWTSSIAYNGTLANIQTAVQGLTGIGSGNVIVTGFQLSAAGYAGGIIFTFVNSFGSAFLLDFDFSGTTGPTQNLSAMTRTTAGILLGQAIDMGSGKVGFPVANMTDIFTNAFVCILGTRNYDGQYVIDAALSTRGRLVVTATYVYEVFNGSESVFFGCPNGKDISVAHDAGGNYYGDIPATLGGLVRRAQAQIFATVVAGGYTDVISSTPTCAFNGDA